MLAMYTCFFINDPVVDCANDPYLQAICPRTCGDCEYVEDSGFGNIFLSLILPYLST